MVEWSHCEDECRVEWTSTRNSKARDLGGHSRKMRATATALYISSLFLFFFFLVTQDTQPILADETNHHQQNHHLRSDQLTVIINGYSESRMELLSSIAVAYSSMPSVAAVLILWGSTSTPLPTLTQLSHNLTYMSSGAPIWVLPQPTQSLNARFLPRSHIKTRAVAICDDDVQIDAPSLEFAFKIWSTHQDRLVGFFPRSHDIHLSPNTTTTWIYTLHSHKYSILLTKLMILSSSYLDKYSSSSCESMRNLVDEMMNCEDILMNFVVSNHSNSGPILVQANKLRDHGDARNHDHGGGMVRQVGLSSRRRHHMKRRGDCITEFHRLMGKMPLKYSYGKLVNSVGEQALCNKNGANLVLCDH